jgi:acetylornithine deacetylase/succinyl-diaminopimelate desuccinylase family protein
MISKYDKELLINEINNASKDLIDLVSGAVKIPSITPTYPGIDKDNVMGGETRVNEYFREFLTAVGLETSLITEVPGRSNLVARLKTPGKGKSLIFNGHVDVVPPGPESAWTQAGPWSGKIADGKIWGRGSCDMKGGLAAVMIAVRSLLNAGFKPSGEIIIESVVGEEMMNTEAGTGAVIKHGVTADAAIVMEPTSNGKNIQLVPASVGTLLMKCRIKGKAGHSTLRGKMIRAGGLGSKIGVSSIDKAYVIYQALRQLEENWGQSKQHPLFSPGHFTIHPGTITGGPEGPFVISEESILEYAIFHAPQDDREMVIEEIEEQIYHASQNDPWLRDNPPEISWLVWWPPFDVDPQSDICKSIQYACNKVYDVPVKIAGFPGNNDAAFLNLAGIPAVTIGPGNLDLAHAANEHILISELMEAVKIYTFTILDWCGYEKN